jgi:hypothetical protein
MTTEMTSLSEMSRELVGSIITSCSPSALAHKVYFGETRNDPTPRGYVSANCLFSREPIRGDAQIKEFHVLSHEIYGCICTPCLLGERLFVILRDEDGIWWSVENVGAPLLQRAESWLDAARHKKLPEQTQCETRGSHIRVLVSERTLSRRKTMNELVEWMIARKGLTCFMTENCKTFAASLYQWIAGKNLWECFGCLGEAVKICAPFCEISSIAVRFGLVSANTVVGAVNRVLTSFVTWKEVFDKASSVVSPERNSPNNLPNALSSRLHSILVSGKVFFGETQPGVTPRGYSNMTTLMNKERVNPNAVIREVRVYAGNLEGTRTLTHLYFSHWYVVVRDSDNNWWSVEDIGTAFVQRVDNHDAGKYRRKSPFTTQVTEREMGLSGITTKISTTGRQHRTMSDLLAWLLQKSSSSYHLTDNNCQDFADDLCTFLAGHGVSRVSTRNPVVGAALCIPVAPFHGLVNGWRGLWNYLVT